MHNHKNPDWQLSQSIDAIVFDCDGTLSQIEGINYLAAENGVEEAVRVLTEKAMSETGISAALYKKRLDLVQPSAIQLAKLGTVYYDNVSPEAEAVITIFQQLRKSVYVVSAGIQSAVEDFGKRLHIPAAQILAVSVYFDHLGNYCGYDKNSPMAAQGGKRMVIDKLKLKHARLAFLGDGMNDVEAADLTDRFIGYGGSYFRPHIANLCEFYIKCKSFSPLLPLCLTEKEMTQLSSEQKKIYQCGVDKINQGLVLHGRHRSG